MKLYKLEKNELGEYRIVKKRCYSPVDIPDDSDEALWAYDQVVIDKDESGQFIKDFDVIKTMFYKFIEKENEKKVRETWKTVPKEDWNMYMQSCIPSNVIFAKNVGD
jgi:hypothetical protein